MMKKVSKTLAVLLITVIFMSLLPWGNGVYAYSSEQEYYYAEAKYHEDDLAALNKMIIKNKIKFSDAEWWIDRSNNLKLLRVYELNLKEGVGDLDLTPFENLHTFTTTGDCAITGVNASNLKELYSIKIGHSKPTVTTLNVQGLDTLTRIYCDNQRLKTLDVRGLKRLWILSCSSNELTSLNVAGCDNLDILDCSNNKLQHLNYNLPELTYLKCSSNNLTTLNVSHSKKLEVLYCAKNQLVNLNVSGLIELAFLYCEDNQLTNLDISELKYLEKLNCSSNKLSGSFDLSKIKRMEIINIDNNEITELKLPSFDFLWQLYCKNNRLTELQGIANRENLSRLVCSGNKISSLDLSGLDWLWLLECDDNELETINTNDCSRLEQFDCSGNKLQKLDLSKNSHLEELDCRDNNITQVILNDEAPYNYLNVSYNNMEDYSDIQGKSLTWDKPSINQYYFTPQKILISMPGDTSIIFPFNPGGNIPITIPQKPETVIPSMPGKSTLIDYPLGLSGNKGSSLNDAYQAFLKERNKELGISDVTLTFNTMGGNEIDSISGLPGTTIDLFEYMPTRDSHIFYGWYEDAGYTNQIHQIKLTENRTVYAKWETLMAPVQPDPISFYADASDWAITELEKAYDADLIPEILKGLDMKKSISREEFAELAVRLYETVTGKNILVTGSNPFTDTSNLQILKAYQAGITAGTSETTFSPDTLISREQCATMLYRAIKAIVPKADYSIAGIEDFPDQTHISSWAVEGTKYMSKLGIILGNTQGEFMPKPLTKAHETSGYGMAAREAAVLMAIRTFEKIK